MRYTLAAVLLAAAGAANPSAPYDEELGGAFIGPAQLITFTFNSL